MFLLKSGDQREMIATSCHLLAAFVVLNLKCVYVFVFILFHREGFFRLQNVQDILVGADQRSCIVNISFVLSAKFPHLHIWKCHISPPKTKTPAYSLGYNLLHKKMIYIEHINRPWCNADKWWKDTKDKEATLI